MRIVYACAEQPWGPPYGALLRDYHLILGLAREHAVTLVTFAKANIPRGPQAELLFDACEEVIEISRDTCPLGKRYDESADARDRLTALFSSRQPLSIRRWESPPFVDALRRVRESRKVDAVLAARAFVGERALEAGYERVVVDMPDLESAALHAMLTTVGWYKSKPIDWAELAKLRQYERRLPERFWRVTVCKEEDRTFLNRRTHGNVFLVPNGTSVHPPAPAETEIPGEMLFVGMLGYYPNVDAVMFFHDRILPIVSRRIPNARFRIVGRRPVQEILALDNGGNCIVTGAVDDLAPYYAQASVVVVPMRLGAGTKLKTVEALAYGKAMVTTTAGAEGFELRPGTDVEIADTPQAFADACVRLLEDSARRRQLGASGRARTLERYSWPSVASAALTALA
jgi:polysaccharide biosynthesis protein PslH